MSGLSNISTPRRHSTQKPRFGSRVDWGHPLANGLLAAVPLIEGGGPPQDMAQGNVPALLGGTNRPGWSGQDLTFTAGTSASVSFVQPVYLPLLAYTASFEVLVTSIPSSGFYTLASTRNLGSTGWAIFLTSTGQIQFFHNGVTINFTLPQVFTAGMRLAITLSTTMTLSTGYATNLATGVTYSASVTPVAGSYGGQTLCLGDDDNTRSFGGSMRWFTLHSRALAADEVRALHKEPYGFYAQPSLSRYPKVTVSPPGIPSGLSATNAAAPVLTWALGTGETSANVLRSTTSGSGYASVATGVSGTTFTDTSAVAGQTYYYVVQAVNISGTSGNSAQASAYTQPLAPAALAGVSGSGQVTLNAGAATGGGTLTYNVYDGTSFGGEGGTAVLTGQTNPAAMVVTGLTNGTKYFFVATAQNAAGEGAHSNETGVIPVPGNPAVRRISSGFM